MNSGYDPVHPVEKSTLGNDPNIGASDRSECLPGWIKTLCEKHTSGEGFELSHSAVSALAHTLIAARVRQDRLVAERDAALERVKDLQWQLEAWEHGL